VTEAYLAVERVREDVLRIVVGGEIDLANASTVEHQIVGAISNQLTEVTEITEITEITDNLTTLAYIDSAACGCCSHLAPAWRRCR
jgi:hypothetical protein